MKRSELSIVARAAWSVVLVFVGLGLIVYAAQDTLVILQESMALPVPILPALKAFGMAKDYGFEPFAQPVEDGVGQAPTIEAVSAAVSSTPTATPENATILVTPTANAGDPQATPTAQPTERVRTVLPGIPRRLVIPSIDLDVEIVDASQRNAVLDGYIFSSWMAPNKYAVGWHTTSARLAEVGNTVLNGHHNVYGKVFENLHKVQSGDKIRVYAEGYYIEYVVSNVMILPERDVDLETRIENSRWIQRSRDERLTLVTCWPESSNTHRLIVVAQPIDWGEDIPPEREINMD